MDEIDSKLKELENMEGIPPVKILTINDAIDQYCEQLANQME